MEPTFKSRYDPRIDVLRAIAFLLVTIVHYAIPTWTDKVKHDNIFEKLCYSLIETGWLGVSIFLFISGYSLAMGKIESGHINLKNYFINRVLRIYPIWIIVILLLSFTHKISGTTVFTLLFLQTQDLPPANAFNICWSIQLEFMCYLIFPILLSIAATRHSTSKRLKGVLLFFAFLLLVRMDMAYIHPITFFLSYGTIFGAGTIFLAGILTASLKPLKPDWISRLSLMTGIFLFFGLSIFLVQKGGVYGYQTPNGQLIHWIFVFFPEIVSAIIFLIIRGFLTERSIQKTKFNFFFRSLVHIGKVSYSGFVFSMFVLDLVSHEFISYKIVPTGWISLVYSFSIYLALLIGFSTISYHSIELPFLNMRRNYLSLDHVLPQTESLQELSESSRRAEKRFWKL